MQARAILAVFEDFVRQFGLVFDRAKSIFEKEIGNARKKTDGLNAVHFCFFDKRAKDAPAGTLAFRFRLDDNGPHFAQVWAVEVQRAATEEDARCV